jgi:hypothetical protein
MNWLLINKILNLFGLKTKVGYFVIAPALLGVLKLISQSSNKEVHLATTTGLTYALALCFAGLIFLRDLFCPDLIKGIGSEQEYVQTQTEFMKALDDRLKQSYALATTSADQQTEILKGHIKPELSTVFSDEEAERLAEALAARLFPVGAFISERQLPANVPAGLPHVDINTLGKQNRSALLACFALVGIGVIIGLMTLSFALIPISQAILRRGS